MDSLKLDSKKRARRKVVVHDFQVNLAIGKPWEFCLVLYVLQIGCVIIRARKYSPSSLGMLESLSVYDRLSSEVC